MTDWLEQYESFPERRNFHLETLDKIENGIYTGNYFVFPNITKAWVSIAILHEKYKAVNVLLDVLNVPDNNLTIKERISYFYLLKE